MDTEFSMFEGQMSTFHTSKEDGLWPLLTTDTQEAIIALRPDDLPYINAKTAILQRMGVSMETQMAKWWGVTIKPGDMVIQVSCRLQDLAENYLDRYTMRQVAAIFSKEKLYSILPNNIYLLSQAARSQHDQRLGCAGRPVHL